MLMFMTLFFTAVAVVLELVLIYHVPRLAEFFRRNILAGAIFSVLLSVLLGSAFGAGGMIVMGAGMLSTLITAVLYKLGFIRFLWRMSDWNARRESRPEKFAYIRSTYAKN